MTGSDGTTASTGGGTARPHPATRTADAAPAGAATVVAGALHRIPLLAACLAVLVQITHPLLGGRPLAWATIAAVVVFAIASLSHAARTAGVPTAALVALAAGGTGLLAEVVGTRTGIPFGDYAYAGTLGVSIATVPLVVPLAWIMMAWPAYVAARLLTLRTAPRLRGAATVGIGAWTLASWDLFLDPQMTAAGHWRFADPVPGLPGLPGIPLTNYLGWLLTSVVIMTLLHLTARAVRIPGPGTDLLVPALLLGWTWAGSALANVAFFDRPAVALWGGCAMGLTVLPFLRAVARRRGDVE